MAAFARRKKRALAELRAQVASGEYRPLPCRQILIPKKAGGWRELRVPTVRDRIVQQAVLNILYPLLEPEFARVSFAYRPGRSHHLAVEQVAAWQARGYEWVLDADIVKFFDRLAHARLLAECRERLDQPELLRLIEAWISAGVLTPDGILLPRRGVPQGAVVSPILANLYLDDFDDALIAAPGLELVRYADDFVVLAKREAQIEAAREQVAALLSDMGLELHPEKTQITNFERGFRFLGHAFSGDLVVPVQQQPKLILPRQPTPSVQLVHADPPATGPTVMQQALVAALQAQEQPIPPPLYVVLGYAVRERAAVPIASKETIWQDDMATLYLIDQGTKLSKEQGRLIVAPPGEERLEIPIREVERILVFGNIQLTTPVLSVCLAEQIPVVFLTQLGEYKGQLWGMEARNFALELAQFARRPDSEFQLATSRALVWGKLMNSKQLLLRLNRKRRLTSVRTAIEGLTADLAQVEMANNLDSLRGYEGSAAARYFPAWGQLLVHPDFRFTTRHRRPPTDPVNSLLSFGYTLLFENILSLIFAEGLSPYMGHFHYGEKQKPYLAFDLVEEFRAPIVDSLVVKLINKRLLRPTDFTWPTEAGGVYLEERARRIFLKHLELRFSETTAHPDVSQPVSYRRVMELQVRRYRRSVVDGVPYEAFLRTV
ncbi:MAG: CRISPR-associated endonuclease Cas1 [Spirulinaceae cyanobacterium SM2_1_0]|nr:CRISPR-associated endonuclease Cas1 [Spirulinaceae cyanobacterium SM2_1_0]